MKHRFLLDACERFLIKNGSSTADTIIDGATLLNGTGIKNARCCSAKSSGHLSGLLARDPRFTNNGLVKVMGMNKNKQVVLWSVRNSK